MRNKCYINLKASMFYIRTENLVSVYVFEIVSNLYKNRMG